MTISEDAGSVATLWRFPVKSMGGEQLRDVEVTERGVLGGRAAPENFTIDQYHPDVEGRRPWGQQRHGCRGEAWRRSFWPILEWSRRSQSVLSSMCFPSRC